MALDPVNQRITKGFVIGMNDEPRLFIGDQDSAVFIHDVQFAGGFEKRITGVGRRRSENIVVQIDVKLISFTEPGGDFTTLAVELDVFRPDRLIHHGFGQVGKRLRKEFVQPLSGIVFTDHHTFHRKPLFYPAVSRL